MLLRFMASHAPGLLILALERLDIQTVAIQIVCASSRIADAALTGALPTHQAEHAFVLIHSLTF